MSKLVSVINTVGSRLVDKENPLSTTNQTTLAAGGVGSIAGLLITFPDPHAQTLGYILLGVSGLIAFIKEKK